MLIFVPITFVLQFTHAEASWIFIASGVAIIPIAGILGETTVHLAEHVGPGVGGLLNATFGNAAEHSAAILVAMKNKMDVAVTIAIGSSNQVALLFTPIPMFLSYFVGPEPMDLLFSPLEVLAIILSAILVNFMALDGKSHWMEGVQLLAVYFVLGTAFFFLPPW